MSLAPVWELGGSIFNTASALQGLFAAASVDDVQPQAIQVAEALGHLFWASSRRIGEGVDALGGNDNIRLERFKVSIGLHSGGVRRIMRESPALVKFFLMVTALKICHDDQEIGDILFEMFDQSSLSGKLAVSPAQMGRLVSVVSAHCNCLLPHDLQNRVVDSISAYSDNVAILSPVETRPLARLLVSVFEQLHDSSISSVYVGGHVHSGWMATTLLWLLDQEAGLVVHDNLIFGSPDCKVSIVVDSSSQSSWVVKVFREDREVTSNVHIFDNDHEPSLNRVPITTTRQLVRSQIKYEIGQEAMVLEACRLMIEATTELLFEKGCIVSESARPQAQLINLAVLLSSSSQPSPSSVAESYGWPSRDQELQCATSRAAANVVRHVQTYFPTFRTVFDEVCTAFGEMLEQAEIGLGHLVRDICGLAVSVAVDAVVGGLVEQMGPGASTKPDVHRRLVRAVSLSRVGNDIQFFNGLMGRKISPEKLFDEALTRLLPGHVPAAGDLIVCHEGIVAGLACVWEPHLPIHASLRLRLAFGDIRKAGMSYDRIVEIDHSRRYDPTEICELPHCPRRNKVLVMPPQEEQYRLTCSVATYRRQIEVKHYLSLFSDDASSETKQAVAWRSAAFALTTAVMYNKSGNGAARRSRRALPDTVYTRLRIDYPVKDFKQMLEGDIRIVPVWNSPVLMLAAASSFHTLNKQSKRRYSLLVHQQGTIETTVAYAIRGEDWTEDFVILVI